MKVFCKLTHSLVNDINRKLFFETHTKIPLQIDGLISPILRELVTIEGLEFPINFASILEKKVLLNPLA